MVRTRGDRAIRWIESFCLYPNGPKKGKHVRLSAEQCVAVRRIYDNPNGFADLSGINPPLMAYLALMHVCGPEALGKVPPPQFAADIFTVWNATGPRLREVLKRHGEAIICPELGTAYPRAA